MLPRYPAQVPTFAFWPRAADLCAAASRQLSEVLRSNLVVVT